MSKPVILKVLEKEITVINENGMDMISLTDMIKAKDGGFFVTDWLRNRNTLEFLSIWEKLNNPDFNYGEFAIIKNQSGLNTYKISAKEWVEKTGAIGIVAKTGRYGGTYANKDIAFEFGTWISPMFKLYLIKEFQRLKEEEAKTHNLEWDYRRFLSKVNYRVQTDAIKEVIIPKYKNLSQSEETYIYVHNAEMVNMAVFGCTAKQWRQEFPNEALKGLTIRDFGTIPQNTVLANIEAYNSELIRQLVPPKERFEKLKEAASNQLKSLLKVNYTYPIESPHLAKVQNTTASFDQHLKGLLNTPPPNKESK